MHAAANGEIVGVMPFSENSSSNGSGFISFRSISSIIKNDD
jgi:hypothetical protein